MFMLRHSNTQPPIYYLHSESDLSVGDEILFGGLSSGFLDTKQLDSIMREKWEYIFKRYWQGACQSLAIELKNNRVDAFATVPSSRSSSVNGITAEFKNSGLIELPDLITKNDELFSFAAKDLDSIAQNISLNLKHKNLNGVSTIVLVDDYSETGKTLIGLYSILSSRKELAGKRILLSSVGIATQLTKNNNR